MNLSLHLESASSCGDLPDDEDVHRWVSAALTDHRTEAEICIRIVDEDESAELNQRYRGKSNPTNVLSFPAQLTIDHPLLGDLVICAPVVTDESHQQGKSPTAHWAHILIHGTLHLLGFDHIEEAEATEMEQLEVDILKKLGFPDPYHC